MSIWKPGLVLPADKLSPGIILEIKTTLQQNQAVALTAWAEARSRFEKGKWIPNPTEAMCDIVNIIDNRAKGKWITHKAVCLAKAQFSCWAPFQGDKNFQSLMEQAQRLIAGQLPMGALLDCCALAEGLPMLVDTLSGATHYYSPASMVPPGRVPPWAVPPAVCVATRHGHKFYNNVRW